MIRINKILVATIIGSFLLIPCLKSYAVKKASKASKPAKTQQETVASQSAVVFVFPVNIEKQPFKPVERVITGIFINKQQDEKEKDKDKKVNQDTKKQSDKKTEANKDNKANASDSENNKTKEPR